MWRFFGFELESDLCPHVLKPETGPKKSFSIKIFDSDLNPLKKRNKNETASSPGK